VELGPVGRSNELAKRRRELRDEMPEFHINSPVTARRLNLL